MINMKMLYKALQKCKLLLFLFFKLKKNNNYLKDFHVSTYYQAIFFRQCADSTRKTNREKIKSNQ